MARYETLTYAVDDRVAAITFNRPERMNALSKQLIADIMAAIAEADADPEVRVLVLTGAGGKAFSAGYDIKESITSGGPRRGEPAWRERLKLDLRFCYAPWDCTKPVIAMIDGFCLAGALEFAQMCDIRYCSDDAKFGVLESRFAAGVATMIMPWILGAACRELIYTGDMIGAQEAQRLGLVTRVYPKAELPGAVMKIAKRMGRVADSCLRWNKRSINQSFESMGLRSALQYGLEACLQLDNSGAPEFLQFDAIRREKGLTEAIRWRDGQFAPFE
jgi:enoyl-CoA hydratase/carnithine racemase